MNQYESKNVFDDVIGQSVAISILNSALIKNRIAPAYLFTGPNGVGRRLTANRFLEGVITGGSTIIRERRRLEALNHPDLIWVEPTYIHKGNIISKSMAKNESISKRSFPQIRLEQIRRIKTFLSKKPLEARLGMVVIEAVEMINEAAANALLKTLEEPCNGILILISERPERLLETIRSRCHKVPFSRLKLEEIEKILSNKQLNQYSKDSIGLNQKELISLSNGSPGALIENMEMWQGIPNDIWIRLQGITKNPIDALSLARDIAESIDEEQQIWLINLFQYYLWNLNNDAKPIKRLEILRSQLMSFVQPRLAWEVALLELTQEKFKH